MMTIPNHDFIQDHLDRVSRSFAFCIRQLPEPLKLWVGVSYLLCRVVDTIEDSDFPDPSLQSLAFDWFDQNIERLSAKSDAFKYPEKLMPTQITEGERLLLEDSSRVFQVFWSMDSSARTKVSRLAHSMSLGMRHFRLRQPGPLKLKDLKEVNQYCFFVAGLVGEMLAEFVSQVEPKFSVDVPKILKAHHFGLFLQKVNLLKDQLKDQKLGRFLIPSRSEVESSVEENAHHAIEFLTELPLEQVEFRRFCAWSLFMGIDSLKREVKPTRPETEDLLVVVEENLQDNLRLNELFKTLTTPMGWVHSSPKAQKLTHPEGPAPSWMMGLYKGQLGSRAVGSLGIS
jgi:hypothetical protein